LKFTGDEPFCWMFDSTSFDIVIQGRHAFKFDQSLDSSRTPIDFHEIFVHDIYLSEGRGLPLLKCVLKHDAYVRQR